MKISKRLLQIFMGLNVLVAIYKGGAFVLLGIDAAPLMAGSDLMIKVAEPVRGLLDFWFRVMGWTWLGVGLMLGWIIPSIERHTAWFRFIMIALMGTGVGNLAAVLASGSLGDKAIEIVIEITIPLACIAWQTQVANRSKAAG